MRVSVKPVSDAGRLLRMRIAIAVLLPLLTSVCGAQEMAVVEGRVVDAVTKQPVAGARVVSLRLSPGYSYGAGIFETEAKQTPQPPESGTFVNITGEDGKFAFTTTTPARFRIFTRRQGYVDAGMSFETVKTIEAKPGETLGGIEIVMVTEGFISGRIVDADSGEPVKGLSVTPMQWRDSAGTHALMFAGASGTTDENGAYELKGLRPGEYSLRVQPAIREKFLPAASDLEFQGLVSHGYTRSFYPGVEREDDAAMVTLLPGGKLSHTDFKVRKRKAAAIRGRIYGDADAAALGEVILSLTAVQVAGDSRSYQVLARGKLRAGDGFMLESLAPGNYSLMGVARSNDPKERRVAFANFQVEDTNVDHVDLHLWRGATVRGRIVVDEAMRKLAERPLTVGMNPQERAMSASEREVKVSMPEGLFVLEGQAEGKFRPYVGGLPRGLVLGRVLYNGAVAELGIISLNRGALEHNLDLILAAATASVTASVRDGGRPAAGAQVVLVPERHDPVQPQLDAKTVTVDAEGRGTIPYLRAGKYKLLAFPAGTPWRMAAVLLRNLGGAKEVTLSGGEAETVDVRLIAQP